MSLDRGFLHRIYGVTVGLGGLLTVGLACMGETPVVLSFVAGLVMGLGLLMSQDYVASQFFAPSDAEHSGRAFALLGVRYGLTVLLLYALTQNRLLNAMAFIGGFLLTHAVIVAYVAGIFVLKRLGVSAAPPPRKGFS